MEERGWRKLAVSEARGKVEEKKGALEGGRELEEQLPGAMSGTGRTKLKKGGAHILGDHGGGGNFSCCTLEQ